jgi:hypothetical protein
MKPNPKNVFINCPFDDEYFVLLKPLLFALVYMDLTPKISETYDSGEFRLNKLKELMLVSQFSIHDISRMESKKPNYLPRFNMPFECGIDFGLRMSNKNYQQKKFLILDSKPYRYQKAMSDLSGNDIKTHSNNPEHIVKAVRDWLKINLNNIPYYIEIWYAYNEFEYDFETISESLKCNSQDINALTFCDIIQIMSKWAAQYKQNQTNPKGASQANGTIAMENN